MKVLCISRGGLRQLRRSERELLTSGSEARRYILVHTRERYGAPHIFPDSAKCFHVIPVPFYGTRVFPSFIPSFVFAKRISLQCFHLMSFKVFDVVAPPCKVSTPRVKRVKRRQLKLVELTLVPLSFSAGV